MKHYVAIENIPPASPKSFYWMTQNIGKISMQQQRKNLFSLYKKILFCNSTNNLKQKESSASFFNCFSKFMVTGVFWWVLNILHFAHYFYLYWIGVIFFFLFHYSKIWILHSLSYVLPFQGVSKLQLAGAIRGQTFFWIYTQLWKIWNEQIVAYE